MLCISCHFIPLKPLTLRMEHAKLLDVLTWLPVSHAILPRPVCFAKSRPANHAICSFTDSSGYASGQIRICLFIDHIIEIFMGPTMNIKHIFLNPWIYGSHMFCIALTIAGSPWRCLNTRPIDWVLKHLPRDTASVNAMKHKCVIVILACLHYSKQIFTEKYY